MTSTTNTEKTPSVASLEWLAAGGVVALGVACALNPAGIEDGPVLCPFRLATGLECPGCGLTRAWVYATHGQFGASFAANPFGIPLLLLVVAVAVVVVVRRVRRERPPSLDALVAHPLAKIGLGAWLLWALARIALSF